VTGASPPALPPAAGAAPSDSGLPSPAGGLSRLANGTLSALRRHPAIAWLVATPLLVWARARLELAIPKSIWEQDEAIFASSARHHDLWTSSPHPPGYPLWSAAGAVASRLSGTDPDTALRCLSALGATAALYPIYALGRRLSGPRAGLLACLIWISLPVTIFFNGAAFADVPVLPFFFAALLAVSGEPSRRSFALGGLLGAVAVGFRPPLATVVVPALLAPLAYERSRNRLRLAAAWIAAFGLGCLAWFVPLVADAGGFRSYLEMLRSRAEWVAAAHVDEGPIPWFDSFLFRDFVHPVHSLVLLGLALAGGVLLWRRGKAWFALLVAASAWTIQLGWLQNRSIARYGIGWGALVAILAAAALHELCFRRKGPFLALSLILVLPAGLLAWSRLDPASTLPSPIASAMARLGSELDPERDVILGETIFWSFFRESRQAGKLLAPAREVNDLIPWRDPFPTFRKTMIEDRTEGDWMPPGPRALVWDRSDPPFARLSQDRLLRVAWDPDAIVFSIGSYPPEFPLTERPFRWMSGRAWAFVPPSDGDRLLVLEIDVPDWYPLNPIKLEVAAGDRVCLFGRRIPPGHHWLRILVPAIDLSPSASTRLEIWTDQSRIPAEMGFGSDRRWLAYRILSARFVPADRWWSRDWKWWIAPIGRLRILDIFGAGGFHASERTGDGRKSFRWTSGETASIEIPASLVPDPEELRLSIAGRGPDGTEAEILLDGLPVGRIQARPGWFEDHQIPLRGRYAPIDGFHRIELRSTASEPTEGDRRRLGVAVERIGIR
jgi:hypothetical protein